MLNQQILLFVIATLMSEIFEGKMFPRIGFID